ncbi:hypothetical protein HGA91_01020 [candidate division WWE3 bacterium]|nr:hypothetical protein [candidate division WWE3 bacterium]
MNKPSFKLLAIFLVLIISSYFIVHYLFFLNKGMPYSLNSMTAISYLIMVYHYILAAILILRLLPSELSKYQDTSVAILIIWFICMHAVLLIPS